MLFCQNELNTAVHYIHTMTSLKILQQHNVLKNNPIMFRSVNLLDKALL